MYERNYIHDIAEFSKWVVSRRRWLLMPIVMIVATLGLACAAVLS